jgi:hypothetical protein
VLRLGPLLHWQPGPLFCGCSRHSETMTLPRLRTCLNNSLLFAPVTKGCMPGDGLNHSITHAAFHTKTRAVRPSPLTAAATMPF